MLFVGTSIIHHSTEGVFLLCNILDLLIYSYRKKFSILQKKFQTRSRISEACQPHPPSPTRSHNTENGGAGPSLHGGAARGIMEMQCLRLQADRNGRGVCGWKTGKRLPQPVINRPFYKPQTPRPFLSECGVSTHSIFPPLPSHARGTAVGFSSPYFKK